MSAFDLSQTNMTIAGVGAAGARPRPDLGLACWPCPYCPGTETDYGRSSSCPHPVCIQHTDHFDRNHDWHCAAYAGLAMRTAERLSAWELPRLLNGDFWQSGLLCHVFEVQLRNYHPPTNIVFAHDPPAMLARAAALLDCLDTEPPAGQFAAHVWGLAEDVAKKEEGAGGMLADALTDLDMPQADHFRRPHHASACPCMVWARRGRVLTVEVTPEDIARGMPGGSYLNPVAMALSRAAGSKREWFALHGTLRVEVDVSVPGWQYEGPDDDLEVVIDLPTCVSQWLESLHHGHAGQPITFRLPVPVLDQEDALPDPGEKKTGK
jgi:hypothetical protein